MFVINAWISKYTSGRDGKLFVCFVDFKKAFDTVLHNGLFYKMMKQNISGKFIQVLMDMYDKNKLQVRVGDYLTNRFLSEIGVRQGDTLSPNLFKMFINDLPTYLRSDSCAPVEINGETLNCLMYADDVVIFSKTADGLQECLKGLGLFCADWGLTVNITKTKVVIFSKGGKKYNARFDFNGQEIEQTSSYKYLGVDFQSSVALQLLRMFPTKRVLKHFTN